VVKRELGEDVTTDGVGLGSPPHPPALSPGRDPLALQGAGEQVQRAGAGRRAWLRGKGVIMRSVRGEPVKLLLGSGCAYGAHTLRCAASAGATRSPLHCEHWQGDAATRSQEALA
jgi:hypothetical protein